MYNNRVTHGFGYFVIGLVVIIGIAFGHVINWLTVKGIIWVAHELFNINWYGKFWVIYVAIIIIGAILGRGKRK